MNILLIHFYLECLCCPVLAKCLCFCILFLITLFFKFVGAIKKVSVTRVFIINYHFYSYPFLSFPFYEIFALFM